MSYLSRIARSDGEDVILLKLCPTIQISRWVNPLLAWNGVGGYSNVMFTTVDTYFHGAIREGVAFKAGKKKYIEVNGIYECDQTPKSWFHDSVAGRVYANPDGEDLDTLICGFRIALYYGTKPNIKFEEFYLPYLAMSDDLGSTEVKVNDKLFGMGSYSGGNLSMINAGGEWDDILLQLFWMDADAEFRHGVNFSGDPAPFDEYEEFRTAIVSDWDWTHDKTEFSLANPFLKAKGKTHKTTYASNKDNGDNESQQAYPNMTIEDEGKVQPHILADPTGNNNTFDLWQSSYKAVCVDIGTVVKKSKKKKGQIWKVAHNPIDPETGDNLNSNVQDVLVRDMTKDTIVVLKTTAWTALENQTAVQLGSGFNINLATQRLRINFGGPKDDSTGKYTGTPGHRIKRGLHCLHYFMVQEGLTTAQIDIASHTEIGNSKPDEFGVSVTGTFDPPSWYNDHKVHVENSESNYEDVINTLLHSMHSTEQYRGGKFYLVPITNIFTDDILVLNEPEIYDWQQTFSLDEIPSRVTLQGEYNQHADKPKQKKSDATVTINAKDVHQNFTESLYGYDNELVIPTFLKKPQMKDAANEFFNGFKFGNVRVGMKTRNGRAMRLCNGDKLLINKDRCAGGPYIEKLFIVLENSVARFSRESSLKLMEIY